MREKLNCPNCGAPIESDKCPYCGALFYDFCNMDATGSSPTYVRLRIHNQLMIFKAYVTEFAVHMENYLPTMYLDDKRYAIQTQPLYDLELSMRVVPDERGVLIEARKLPDSQK